MIWEERGLLKLLKGDQMNFRKRKKTLLAGGGSRRKGAKVAHKEGVETGSCFR